MTVEPPPNTPGYQFRRWHLFAAITWIGVAIALFVSEMLFPLGVLFVAGSICVAAFRLKTSVGFLVTGLLLAIALLLPAGRSPRAGRRAMCINNLKNITLALQNYESRYGSFPPAYIADKNGKPMHSWRVLILPQLDRTDLYKLYRFDEPWDGPNNRQLHNQVIRYFCCPQDHSETLSTDTSYVAVIGDHTVWPGAKSTSYQSIQAADGTERTILLVETHNSGIHWMDPRDTTVDGCLAGTDGPLAGAPSGTEGNHPGGGVVSFVDGHVTFLSNSITPEELKELLTIDDGKPDKVPEND